MASRHMSAAISIAEPMLTSYDEFSDLRLEIGEPASSFMVCSRAMARSSPAFRGMLFGSFIEGKPTTGEWIVRLPEDEPRSFAILLDVIHGRSDRVPLDLHQALPPVDCTAALLYDVVRMADKYCLLPLLRPWMNPWLAPWRPGGARKDDGWMGEITSVAWIVGDETVLLDQLDRAAESMRFRGMAYKKRGWIRNNLGCEFRLGAMPDGPNKVIDLEEFSELISEARTRFIKLLTHPLEFLSSDPGRYMLGASHYMRGASKADMDKFAVSLTENAKHACWFNRIRPSMSSWDTSTLAAYKGTVSQLYDYIKTIESQFERDGSRNPDDNRIFRGIVMPTMAVIEYIWGNEPLVCITEEHRAHMERRRKVSGVELA
ncbi:hypothetical protein CONLIGDRAFT_632126 [Coniochaeta ligniaria NRRL 30616]|uniref:BTB domain-containing protein n=1 Tax=Coniochaeta ligniaria NRRL 30616 TaxID=1408157 RepID=A0A1J7J9R6_9PEZI|nr:hypothetical protein CONLIGDRAFT_632126 [Coniochaeta ligniaria NRRL 30616]